MALKKGKITKKIWYQDEWWDVKEVISPNKYDDFILLSQVSETEEHPRGVPAVYMILIDAHNDTFMPDTPKARALAGQLKVAREQADVLKLEIDDVWLTVFRGNV